MKTIVAYLQVVCIVFILNNTPMFSQWEQCNGPFGADVKALAIQGDKIFAAIWLKGIFLSTDNGASWKETNNGLPSVGLTKEKVISVTCIAATDSIIFAGFWSKGIYLSRDNGKNWIEANKGLTDTHINCIVIDGSSIYTGTWNGVFRSVDNGISWEQIASNGLETRKVRCISIQDSTTIFAGCSYGLFKSTNKGKTWIQIDSGIPIYTEIQCFAKVDSILYFGSSRGGCYVSNNNGISWSQINNGISWSRDDLYKENLNVLALVVIDSTILSGIYDGGGVCYKTNSDTNWTQVNIGLYTSYVKCLIVSGNNIFAGTFGGGIFLSTNKGKNWEAVNNGLNLSNVSCLSIIDGDLYAGTYGGGIYVSSNNGENWATKNAGLSNPYVTSIAKNENNIFAGTFKGGVFRSANKGSNWEQINIGLSNTFIRCFAFNKKNIFVGTDGTYGGKPVYVSTDEGTNWVPKSWAVSYDEVGLPTYQNVQCLLSTFGNIYAGTSSKGVFVSSNNGSNWSRTISGNILSFAAKDSVIWAGTDNGIIMRKIDQTWWSEPNTNLKNIAIQCIALSGNIIFTGSYNQGIYFSTDNGTNWTQKNSGLLSLNVQSLAVKDSIVFAGTADGSVFKAKISDFIPSSVDAFEINEDDLKVYPNPIVNNSTIEFYTKSAQHISITLSDVLGREVLEIRNNTYFESGRHTLTINAENLPAGVYFCNLKSVNFSKALQIVVTDK